MAEYQRILSYLYRYDNKQKKDCKGFIKAEQKSGQIKLTIQIEDDRLMEDMKLNLCFYEKKEEEWIVHILDRLEIHRQREEMVRCYEEKNLPDNFQVKKQSGVILYYQDSFFYGSVWIGEEIPVWRLSSKQLFGESMDWKKSEELLSEESASRPREEAEEDSLDNMEDSVLSESGMEMESDRLEEKRKDSQLIPEKEKIQSVAERRMPEEFQSEMTEPEAEEERCEKAESKSEEGQSVNGEGKAEEIWEKNFLEGMGLSKENPDLYEKKRDLFDTVRSQAQLVNNIFNPAFYEGYRITLRQLGLLGFEAERLADNQFLRSGFEKHRHLLVGKVRYDGRERYCVGVPGIYENREKYMAEIYRFPVFLALAENRIKTGGFGYWLHLLSE